jgi:flagellar export protein FliJ
VTKKAKLQILGRVRDVRKRLRDAAADDLAAAEATEAAADERRSRAAADVDEVHETVRARLDESRSVRALWTLEHEHRLAVDILDEAKVAVTVARDDTARHRSVLIHRARELKTAEKVIDRTEAGVRHDEKRAEQRSNDDLASRKRPE